MDAFKKNILGSLISIERIFLFGSLAIYANTWFQEGFAGLSRDIDRCIRKFPGVGFAIKMIIQNEVKGTLKKLSSTPSNEGDDNSSNKIIPIPEVGLHPSQILEILDDMKNIETSAEDGKAFAYTYTTNGAMAEFSKTISAAYDR